MSTTGKIIFEIPSNILSLLVYCATDNSLMLTFDNGNGDHWLPSVKAESNTSWSRLIAKEAQEIVGTKPCAKVLRLSKIWYPRKEGNLTLWHCVFQLAVDTVSKNKTKNTMGKYRGKIRWITDTDLSGLLQNNSLRSPELLELYQLARDMEINQLNLDIPDDIMCTKNLCEITEDVLVSGKTTNYEQLVDASGIDKLGWVIWSILVGRVYAIIAIG